jgi:hypothetical protein
MQSSVQGPLTEQHSNIEFPPSLKGLTDAELRNALNCEYQLSKRSGPSDVVYTDLDHAENVSKVENEITRRLKLAFTVC